MQKTVFFIGLLLVLVCVTPAWGQWTPQSTAVVPFEFAVGDKVLPAGTYTVLTNNALFPHSVMIQDSERHSSTAISNHNNIILTPPGHFAESAKLIFAIDGNRHVLHQVVLSGDNHKHDLIHRAEIAELAETSH